MLFVTAAVQRKANFGNRLLKNTSSLKGAIHQTLKMQTHPVLWASLATNGSSPATEGLARPLLCWGYTLSALEMLSHFREDGEEPRPLLADQSRGGCSQVEAAWAPGHELISAPRRWAQRTQVTLLQGS
jgi:hypothetical protein